MSQHSKRPRGRGVYLLVAVVVLFIGAVLSFAVAFNHKTLAPFTHADRAPYVDAPDPITAVDAGLPPTSTLLRPLAPSMSIRAIDIYDDAIVMVAGGRVARVVGLPEGAHTLHGVAVAIGDTTWVSDANGVVMLRAALILESGSHLTIAAPETTAVHMVNEPGVFMGVKDAALVVKHVTIQAVDEQGAAAVTKPSQYRPFVVAKRGASLTADHAAFTNLGYDWNGSYGVSWMDGSGGSSRSSTYAAGFIGVYTDHVSGVVFDGDIYRGNQLYGIDPHSSSSRLTIRNCMAEDNGAHGIIFSDDVTTSTVMGCVSHNNGENGIMMDKRSVGNTISDNSVLGNRGDGIVLSDSPDTVLASNLIKSNRVGVQLSPTSVWSSQVTQNTVVDNVVAAQGVELESSNTVARNGGQWDLDWLTMVWLVVLILMTLGLYATWEMRRNSGTGRLAFL